MFQIVFAWFVSVTGASLMVALQEGPAQEVPAKAVPAKEEGNEPELVPYAKIGDVVLHLHLWRPEGKTRSKRRGDPLRPAVVFFFGGGWRSGTPNQFAPHCERLARAGFVAFSAEYRVGRRNGTTPFECVKDGKSAIRWVREHAAEYGVDPRHILAAGGSAGGHVAACTGVVPGLETETAGESAPKTSSVPDAMVLFNPVLDAGPRGYTHPALKERWRELSPQHHVRPGLPPTLIFHGTGDTVVAFAQAERFRDAMKEHGNRCELVAFDGLEHGFFNEGRHDDVPYEQTLARLLDFVETLGWTTADASDGDGS